jgi:sugar O-acyltransferase (sialic acid O-acetyltransferase NeuD family)
MSESRGIFVFGASGHAKVVIDAIERAGGMQVLFLCDDADEKRSTQLMGYTIVGGREELLARRSQTEVGIVAIGENAMRMKVAAWLLEHGVRLTSVIHPAATIGRDVQIGDGSVVMAGCVINTGARLGRNVIVNTGASVDHDCEVEDGVHIGPGSHLCGHVSVGAGTLVGAGTTLVPSVRVGAAVTVGAGSTVIRDVPDNARVGGSPCRALRS